MPTTTSVANSGFLDAILPVYEREARISVLTSRGERSRAGAVGRRPSGRRYYACSRREEAALREHSTWRYTKNMFNDFVVAGPNSDPAGIRGSREAGAALQRIVEAGLAYTAAGVSKPPRHGALPADNREAFSESHCIGVLEALAIPTLRQPESREIVPIV